MLENKWVRTTIIILGLFLLVKTLDAYKDLRAPDVAYSTIVVSGEGEAFATPDIASFNFSVSADHTSVKEAQTTVTTKVDAILKAIKALGVEDEDINTTNYSVYPKYRYDRFNTVPDGYTVTQSISVKMRNIDDAGKALGVAGENGATNISSLTLAVDDYKVIEAEARHKAVEEARAKAKALAKSLGVRLGRVVDFSDGSYGGGPRPMYALEAGMGGDMKSAPTIPVGESRFVSNVSITYEIR